ncbi:MAG: Fis family transcriptional regulator [Leptospiraceae bacterium]|nr:MAG: Fis family transcriptional regulator [Leptospiraceae bacterium]
MRTFTVKSLIIEKPNFVRKISVQTVIRKGIPGIKILGIPYQKANDLSIKLQTIFLSNQIPLPYENIQVNISPSILKQYYNYLDFSIFMSILLAFKNFDFLNPIEEIAFLGELTLLGELEPIENLSTFLVQGKSLHFNKFIIPKNTNNYSIDINHIKIAQISHIKELLDQSISFEYINKNKVNENELPKSLKIYKNLIEILPLIAGKHSFYFIEKQPINKNEFLNLLSFFIPDILPEEKDEFLIIHESIKRRPIKIIQSNITKKELIGDKKNLMESILYQNQFGFLLVNDFNGLKKDIILLFKTLLENQSINYYDFILKNNFWLLFFSIPCPCGNLFNPIKNCSCNHKQIINFHKKFELYLKESIDIIYFIDNNFITLQEKTMQEIKIKINKAILRQKEKYKDTNFNYNSEIPSHLIEKYCLFENEKTEHYWNEQTKFLSNNEKKIIRKIAQTFCDYSGNPRITEKDLQIALKVRNPLNFFEEPKIYHHFSDPLK